jgi:membrane carboxypeptidase/penicillin-binding protein
VDNRIQRLVNAALESGLHAYETRHPKSRGLIQGSVVVLRNADAAVLAEAGGRQVYKDRYTSYSDYNRVTDSRRQPGSVMKPIVYLAAFAHGEALDDRVADEPISVSTGLNTPPKWIHNYDEKFKGLIPVRQALAESRNAATIRLAQGVGVREILRTARELGIRTPLQPYITTALGGLEVQLLELANAYRALASSVSAEPHVVARVSGPAGEACSRRPLRTRARHRSRSGRGHTGGPARSGPPAQRHRTRAGRRRVRHPGDGQDGHEQRLPRRAVRGIDLRAGRGDGRRAHRLRRQPRAGREGDGRAGRPSHLPRRGAGHLHPGAHGDDAGLPREMEQRITTTWPRPPPKTRKTGRRWRRCPSWSRRSCPRGSCPPSPSPPCP